MGPRVVVVGHTGFLWGLFVFVYVVMETREVGMATPESTKHVHSVVFVDSCKKQSEAPRPCELCRTLADGGSLKKPLAAGAGSSWVPRHVVSYWACLFQ